MRRSLGGSTFCPGEKLHVFVTVQRDHRSLRPRGAAILETALGGSGASTAMRPLLSARIRRRLRSTGSLFVALAALFSSSVFLRASTADARGAQFLGSLASAPSSYPAVAVASTPSGNGYWIVTSRGQVYDFGDASHFGGMGHETIAGPIVDIAATPTGRGYWLFSRSGAVYNFGDADWKGSMRGKTPTAIVAGASTPTGNGYWLFSRSGAVYDFGDAKWRGSKSNTALRAPIEGAAVTRSGNGYWLVGRDGNVYSLGDARSHGSMLGRGPNGAVVDIARTPSGNGYWLVSERGSIYHFGDATFRGSMGRQLMLSPVTSIAAPSNGGYWFVSADGAVFSGSADGNFVADPNALSTKLARMTSDLYYRINAERQARGLPLLAWDPQLARLASQWSTWMGTTQRFGHQDLGALFRDPAYASRYRSLRENIYNGTGSWRTAGAAHLSLMNSDSHRKTILTPELTSVGVGVACLNGRLWVTEEFGVWVSGAVPAPRSTPPRDPVVAGDTSGTSC